MFLTDYSIPILNNKYCIVSVHFKGSQVEFLNFNIFLSLKIVFILENSADPDEMPLKVAFHLGLNCLTIKLPIYQYLV